MSEFTYNHNGQTFLTNPGAWLYNGASSHRWPIFNSGDLTDVTNSIYTHNGTHPTMNDINDDFGVLPGFKLEVFTHGGYGGTKHTIDNTTGTTILYKNNDETTPAVAYDVVSSVRLYYKGTELKTIAPNFAISGAHSIIQGSTYSFIYILGDTSFKYSGSESALTDISMLIVGGGGSGGGDGGYTGGGGGGGGEVDMGTITINANQDYSIYVGAGGSASNGSYTSIYNQSNTKIVEVYGGGRGTDNPGTRHSGASSGVASGAGGSGADVTHGTANGHTDTSIYTFYSNNGGSGYPGRGGGGGGGAGASGGTASGWEGGNGGNGIQWLDTSGGNGEYYGGGGAGQGVNDYPNRSSGGTGGGGRDGNSGTANTGGGGSARQGSSGYASGGSGVVVFRVTNAQLNS
jgi:hypothetical protein